MTNMSLSGDKILVVDPFPNVNKDYAMIQRVEKQRQVTGGIGVIREITASVSKSDGARTGNSEQISTAYSKRNMGRGRRDARTIKPLDITIIARDQDIIPINALKWLDILIGAKVLGILSRESPP